MKYSLLNSTSSYREIEENTTDSSHREGEENTTVSTTRFERIHEFCYVCASVSGDESSDVVKKKCISTAIEFTLAGFLCYSFQFLIHNKFCDFLFKCGCTWRLVFQLVHFSASYVFFLPLLLALFASCFFLT